MRGGMRGRGFGPHNPMMMRGGPRGGFNPGMIRLVEPIQSNVGYDFLLFEQKVELRYDRKIDFTKCDLIPNCRLH